jgi:uncharacterized protein YecE (DUF72 family)
MGRRDPTSDQGMLFAQTPLERALGVVDAAPRDVNGPSAQLAGTLSPLVHLGTSSWTFPGWQGLVYAGTHASDRLARYGLAAYAQHPLMRTVGLDRAFYAALPESEFRELAELTPTGFRFLVKAHQVVTRPDADDQGRTFGNTASHSSHNPRFLDAEYARDIIIARADRGLGEKLGVVLFQFPTLDLSRTSRIGTPPRFLGALGSFLSRLPRGPAYAVEVRNRDLLSPQHAPEYARVLREHGVQHGYVHHPTMPTIEKQVHIMTDAGWAPGAARGVCVRWLLRHDQSYEGARARYQPFAKLVDEDSPTREQVARLVGLAQSHGVPAIVILNNKAEGSAPLSVEQLAMLLATLANSASR